MKQELIGSFVWAVGMLALAVGATLARKIGYVGPGTVIRLVTAAIGLWMAWYGNRIPKTLAPHASARKAQRVAAWSLLLSGLAYAGLWAFAPMPVAVWGGTGVVFAGIAITFGYCLLLQGKARAG